MSPASPPVLTWTDFFGAVLFGMGDVIAQLIAREKGERLDLSVRKGAELVYVHKLYTIF